MLWQWDPIGVAGLAPDDEYDCMILPLAGLLSADADQSALASFLRHQLHSNFGLDPVHDEIESVAGRLVNWRTAVAPTDPDVPNGLSGLRGGSPAGHRPGAHAAQRLPLRSSPLLRLPAPQRDLPQLRRSRLIKRLPSHSRSQHETRPARSE